MFIILTRMQKSCFSLETRLQVIIFFVFLAFKKEGKPQNAAFSHRDDLPNRSSTQCCLPASVLCLRCRTYKSAAICLLPTDNCHLNISLQTAVPFIAVSLTSKCSKETTQNGTARLLAQLGHAGGSRSDTGCASPASRVPYQSCFWQVTVQRSFSSLPVTG